MNNLLRNYLNELKSIESAEGYNAFYLKIIQDLLKEKFDNEIIQNIRDKGKYMTNEFSDVATRKNMDQIREPHLTRLTYKSYKLKTSMICSICYMPR